MAIHSFHLEVSQTFCAAGPKPIVQTKVSIHVQPLWVLHET